MARAPRGRTLQSLARYGYCAAKDEKYHGLKGYVPIDLRGVITELTVTETNVDECNAAYDLNGYNIAMITADVSIHPKISDLQ